MFRSNYRAFHRFRLIAALHQQQNKAEELREGRCGVIWSLDQARSENTSNKASSKFARTKASSGSVFYSGYLPKLCRRKTVTGCYLSRKQAGAPSNRATAQEGSQRPKETMKRNFSTLFLRTCTKNRHNSRSKSGNLATWRTAIFLAGIFDQIVNVKGQFPQQMSQQTQECPQLQTPCRCAPSIYEPVAIICESAGSLGNALQAIQAAKNIRVG